MVEYAAFAEVGWCWKYKGAAERSLSVVVAVTVALSGHKAARRRVERRVAGKARNEAPTRRMPRYSRSEGRRRER